MKNYRCPKCKQRFETAKELANHFNKNRKCKAIARMFAVERGYMLNFCY